VVKKSVLTFANHYNSTSMHDQVHLVLIDDDPGVLRALGLVLKAMKFGVTPFTNPLEALAFLRSASDVDLVITDLRMPEVSGTAVAQSIRDEGLDVPVVVMSGHATQSDIQELKRHGAAGFIPKPFTPDKLIQLVNSLV
jgi:DNA-binding NtrC family response regulator